MKRPGPSKHLSEMARVGIDMVAGACAAIVAEGDDEAVEAHVKELVHRLRMASEAVQGNRADILALTWVDQRKLLIANMRTCIKYLEEAT